MNPCLSADGFGILFNSFAWHLRHRSTPDRRPQDLSSSMAAAEARGRPSTGLDMRKSTSSPSETNSRFTRLEKENLEASEDWLKQCFTLFPSQSCFSIRQGQRGSPPLLRLMLLQPFVVPTHDADSVLVRVSHSLPPLSTLTITRMSNQPTSQLASDSNDAPATFRSARTMAVAPKSARGRRLRVGFTAIHSHGPWTE